MQFIKLSGDETYHVHFSFGAMEEIILLCIKQLILTIFDWGKFETQCLLNFDRGTKLGPYYFVINASNITSRSIRLNSSKHVQAPLWASPLKNLPIAL